MRGILRNICLQKPDAVFFAGRGSALDAFVQHARLGQSRVQASARHGCRSRSGWLISLDPLGNPVNKAVVILGVEPDGTRKFLKLSSPLGSPCVPGIPPC